ncbi:hypothetical protein AT15_06300 [Kosmotoga arenicorallina S304]|uniref:Glucosyltransferase 3-like N-terminal domain-containing protein n=1 Tax=Kosmotoga arenicorallina S304 TaxID=1453497 RepID=A0A176JTV5_9BACT|nr:glycosyltransferase [Kosmotoga arenicorallina]OAA26754.1 hypothetical protein AT15_06300 [Kosmotoga arenicorallina S304]
MDKIVVHIYYGSAGNAGLYIKKIVDAQEKLDYDVKSIVNYYFPFEGSHFEKLFFRYSQLMKDGKMRKIVRYMELFFDHFKTYKLIKKFSQNYKHVFVNYSLNETYAINLSFLKALKRIRNVKLGITVHDIEPFHNDSSKLIVREQDEFLSLADFYIVHNQLSIRKLQERFSAKKDHIYAFKFPLMDLKMMGLRDSKTASKKERIDFLFIGYMRREKGLDVLIDAWRRLQLKYDNVRLTVAGRIPDGVKYSFSGLKNFKLHNRVLNDNEFYNYIYRSDYIILPYTMGTNSGILSTVSSLGKPAITSDLEMFIESSFTIKELMFERGSSDSLYKLLEKVILNHKNQYDVLCRRVLDNIANYDLVFKKEINREFSKIVANE